MYEASLIPFCHLTRLFQSLEKPIPFSPWICDAGTCKVATQDLLQGRGFDSTDRQGSWKRCPISNCSRGRNWVAIYAYRQKLNKSLSNIVHYDTGCTAALPRIKALLLWRSRIKPRPSVLTSLYWIHTNKLILRLKSHF